jgi:hypothetical protein
MTPLPAGIEEIGTPTATYAPKKGAAAVLNILAILFFLALGFALFFAGPIGFYFSGETSWFCATGLGLLSGLGGLWGLYDWYNTRTLSVHVSPVGVAHHNHGKATIIRWDDVNQVWQNVTRHYRNGVYTGTTHYYKLIGNDGRHLEFKNNLQNVEQLGQTLQTEVTGRLLRQAAQTYNSGGTVTFGKLTISKQGLSNGKETLSWDKVKGVKLDRGIISVQKEGKWLNWSSQTVAQTPNIWVFTEMVDRIIGVNVPKK